MSRSEHIRDSENTDTSMADIQYTIPEEFKSQLRNVDALDDRSDGEIIASLNKFIPPTDSEKNIFLFWHNGLPNMPAWSQRNVCDLARLNGPSWTIRVLDADPKSPNYALKYIEPDLLPKCFVDGTMDGPFVGPHQADLLRGAALWKYGGVWVDGGCMPLRTLDDFCWAELTRPGSPFTIAAPSMFDTTVANHFFAARKGDPFIKKWHDYFCYLWKDRTNADGIASDPHFAKIIASIRMEHAFEAGFQWKWDAPPKVVMEYIAQIQAWNVVAKATEPGPDGFDGVDYFDKHVYKFNSLQEDWPAEYQIGWVGQDLYDLLNTRLDIDPQSEDYRKAYKVVWYMLTEASMQKVTRGGGLSDGDHFGTLLDKHSSKDAMKDAPKTFLDLLRYGAVHFEQVGRQTKMNEVDKVDAVIKEQLIPA